MAWEQMVQMQIRLKRMDEAVQSLQDMLKAVPGNTAGEIQLGSLLMLQKKYQDAAVELEGALKLAPQNTDLQVQAGRAELLAGKRDTGEATLRKALDGATDPNVLNDAAYELADSGLDLPLAESSTRKAIDDLDKQTSQIALGNLSTDDLAHVQLLTAAWDTMGWIYFREGKLQLAESYVSAAWNTTQASEVGAHLGQIYEKEGRLKEAAAVDAMALSAATLSPDPSGTDEIRDRLAKLQRRSVALPRNPGEELGTLRTISLSRVTQGEASADFFVLLAAGKVEDATFIRGDERLRGAADVLKKASFAGEFPAGSNGQLVRRGILFCSSATKDCHFTLLLPQSVTLH